MVKRNTHTMRIICLPLVIQACLAAAQTDARTIELLVTDTLAAPLKSITYSCQVMPDAASSSILYNYAPLPTTAKEAKKREEERQRIQDSICVDQSALRALLTSNRFEISTAVAGQEYFVNTNNQNECAGLFVRLGSVAELERLVALLRTKHNLNGYVMKWESDLAAHDDGTVDRLYAMAHARASRLARLSGQKLGHLMSVQEGTDQGAFGGRLAMAQGITNYYQNQAAPGYRSLLFRFALLGDEPNTHP